VEARSLKFIADACAGELRGKPVNALATQVCTDSRRLQAGDLFFALKGRCFDGHDFVLEAARKGAVAVVVNRTRSPARLPKCGVISVGDTRAALGRLAARYRADFSLPFIAVGGSNGKTTTKDLIAAVLRQKLTVLSSEASFNNDIGVPLTLLRLEKTHEAAVLEAGTNHPGELAPLVRMIQPRFGIITNIGREHLEFFGDLGRVAEEEGRLAELLPSDGLLLTDGDSDWADYLAKRTRARFVRVGFSEQNDWRAFDVRVDERGTAFSVDGPKKDFWGEYRINLLGRHQVTNALFAVVVGEELGLSRPAVRDGLAECQSTKMRLQLGEANAVWLLDDTYNANADSVAAALRTLVDMPCSGRRVAVLGDMAELGEHSVDAHAEAGRLAAELGVGQLFAIGEMACVTGRAARAAGLARVFEFADLETAASTVKRFLKPGDLVLLKASRPARLERLAEMLRAPESKKAECCFT
jgi:UDP-N-acetylmuramoyl-tripeptide--D-alanyl-D-alanine ligase